MNGCFTVISWTSPRLSTSFCFAFSRALLQFFSLRESVLVSWFPTKKKKKKKEQIYISTLTYSKISNVLTLIIFLLSINFLFHSRFFSNLDSIVPL